MNNYHDNILIKSAEEQKINYTVIPNLSNYIGNLKKHIPIIGERLELSKLNNYLNSAALFFAIYFYILT